MTKTKREAGSAMREAPHERHHPSRFLLPARSPWAARGGANEHDRARDSSRISRTHARVEQRSLLLTSRVLAHVLGDGAVTAAIGEGDRGGGQAEPCCR